MTGTQAFIPIEDISDDLVYLKDGSVTLVLSTSAVNFGLLFETEQMGIIDAFARLLNSLSFPIQIVIHSKRLDVSSYLKTLNQAIIKQTNPLLKDLTTRYSSFVESIIKEKNVLDKQFYVCISVSASELGVLPKSAIDRSKKATTILAPRRDHLISQLIRLGLKARQLNTVELVKLFYEIYNPPQNNVQENNVQASQLPATPAVQTPIQPIVQPQVAPTQPPSLTRPPVNLTRLNPTKPVSDIYRPPAPRQQQATVQPVSVAHLTPPFVVEELADDFGP